MLTKDEKKASELDLFLTPLQKKLHMRLVELMPRPTGPAEKLYEASHYFLETPGKFLRASLLFVAVYGFGANIESCLDPACSIELLHNYSLIHDDLPCMDDDALRRGRPTIHCKYDEATAVLVGDFFLTYSFEILTMVLQLSDSQKLRLIQSLSRRAGGCGMVAGQFIDLQNEGKFLEEESLKAMHEKKTAELIVTALEFAGIIANVSSDQIDVLQELGYKLGYAYQIMDDILDVTESSETLGKPAQSDVKNDKATIIRLFGLDAAREKLESLIKEVTSLIDSTFAHPSMMHLFVQKMLRRKT